MQRRKGLTRHAALRPGTSRLKTHKPLQSHGVSLKRGASRLKRGSGLKRTPFRAKPGKVNPKDFTSEVILQMVAEQGSKCLRCGRPDHLDPHHKKPRSALTARDLKIHGAGGGRKNCLGLCRECHEDVHAHKPGTERFRTQMNQEVGEDAVAKS